MARDADQVRAPGKQRTAEPHEYPALHNYIWLRPTNAQMPYLAKARFLGGTFHWLSNAAIRQLAAFRERIDAKLQEAKRIEGNRKAIADYAAFERRREIVARLQYLQTAAGA